jgi:hypothetical protein
VKPGTGKTIAIHLSIENHKYTSQNFLIMAKYGKGAQKKVGEVMREYKSGKLKSGKGGRGGKVKSRKQAIAIGLSEARERGAKVPKKKSAVKKGATRKKAAKKSTSKKAASKRSGTKRATKRATKGRTSKRATKSRRKPGPKKASRRSR